MLDQVGRRQSENASAFTCRVNVKKRAIAVNRPKKNPAARRGSLMSLYCAKLACVCEQIPEKPAPSRAAQASPAQVPTEAPPMRYLTPLK